jgi:hypothetical protein
MVSASTYFSAASMLPRDGEAGETWSLDLSSPMMVEEKKGEKNAG